jgi:Uri superfamily endonuclease
MDMERNLDEGTSSVLDTLSGARGNYTLLFFVRVQKQIVIGRLGSGTFQKGYYTYTGSAFGKGSLGLGGRVRRHIRKDKMKRWHIDYLLSDNDISLTAVVACITNKKIECTINQCLRKMFRAQIPFSGFGSSDCTEHCGSHLLFLGQTRNVVEKTVKLYEEKADGDVFVFRFQ